MYFYTFPCSKTCLVSLFWKSIIQLFTSNGLSYCERLCSDYKAIIYLCNPGIYMQVKVQLGVNYHAQIQHWKRFHAYFRGRFIQGFII